MLVASNDRPNITWEVRFIKRKIGVYASTPPYSDLDWTVETIYPSARRTGFASVVPPASGTTVIFMSSMQAITDVVDHLQSIVPPRLRSTIKPYFAMLDTTSN